MFKFLNKRKWIKIALFSFLLFSIFEGGHIIASANTNPYSPWTDPIDYRMWELSNKLEGLNPLNAKVFGWGCTLSEAPCWLNEVYFKIFVMPVGFLLTITGILFDKIVDFTIYQMTDFIYPKGQDLFIGEVWKIFRDLANISLIFILLYAGIQTIINGFNSGAKKTVGTVVIVAILINFSLLFTKLTVDVSNRMTVEIYDAVRSSMSLEKGNLGSDGIATYYITALGLKSLFNIPEGSAEFNKRLADVKTKPGNMFLQSTVSIIVMGVLVIILLLISLTFFARFLIIIFLMLFSSLAFASHLLPALKKKVWDPWFGTLLGQLMFPPVFLLLLLVSAFVTSRMINAIRQLSESQSTNWANLFAEPANIVAAILGVVIPYLIAIGFLVMSFILSIAVAAKGGGYSGMISSKIGGGIAKTVSFAGRNTAGRLGSWASNKIGDPKTAGGAALKRFAERTANASFDPRKATAGKAGRMLGVSQLMERSGFTKAAQSTAGEGLDPKKFSFAAKDKERKERNNTLRNQISDEKIKGDKEGRTYREVYESEMGITRNIFRAATAGAWVSSAERTIPAKIDTLKKELSELEKQRDQIRQGEVGKIEKSAEYTLVSDKITENEAEIKAQQTLMNEARKAGRDAQANTARSEILRLTKEIRENKIKQNELKVVLEKGGTGRVESEKKEKEIEKKKEELEKEKAKLKNS